MLNRGLIQNALSDACKASSTDIMCDGCGVIHFCDDASGHEDFPFDEAIRLAKESSDKYINHGDMSVYWVTVDGKELVIECPCDAAVRYVETVWRDRQFIADIFSSLSLAQCAQAELDRLTSHKVQVTTEKSYQLPLLLEP